MFVVRHSEGSTSTWAIGGFVSEPFYALSQFPFSDIYYLFVLALGLLLRPLGLMDLASC